MSEDRGSDVGWFGWFGLLGSRRSDSTKRVPNFTAFKFILFFFVSFSKQSLPTLLEEGDLHEMMQDEGLGGQGSLDDKLKRAL